MTALQFVVNLILAVLAYGVVVYVMGLVGLPNSLNFLVGFVAALAVFFSNSAARLGVK